MRKYLIGFCFLVIAAAACRKVDDTSVFGKTADQRLTESLAAYQSTLTGQTNGWKALLYTASGGIYSFYFKFNDSNRVKMLSSFDSTSAVTLKESSYRLKALQQPSLLFDTYSYLHVLADPNPAISGGGLGTGLKSDFEFYFEDSETSADTLTLIGRFNASKMKLIRATAAEAAGYQSGQLVAGLQINKILTYFKRIVINGTDSADVHTEPSAATIAVADATGNLLDASRKTSYYLTLNGLGFVKPILIGSKMVSNITNVSYNAATGLVTATVDGSPAVIKAVNVPAKVDVAAPKRWWDWAKRSVYVGSDNGFHMNGVDDALGLKSIAGFQYIQYYPTASGAFDAVRIIASTSYGPAVTPTFPADGRVVFPNSGSQFGTVPTAAQAKYLAWRAQLFQTQGYYAVQTNAGSDETITYDLVSVADAKTWISWVY
jgi:hypothetical protein